MLKRALLTMMLLWAAKDLAHAEPRAKDAAAAAAGVGLIFGTVVWAGPEPKFPYRDCEVHSWDIQGHPEVTGGIADVIVTAEPLDPKLRSAFQQSTPDKDDAEMLWREDIPERVMVAQSKGSLTISNQEDHPVTLDVFADKVHLTTLSLAPEEKGRLRELSEGLLHIVNPDTGSVGWVKVTPYPSQKSAGNCRFIFNPLPAGPYLLRGWHPRAGVSTRKLVVLANPRGRRIRLLIFSNGRRD